jgi:predicted lysophospholipase L1 biosynthesis ABC-type transport system permease subunit
MAAQTMVVEGRWLALVAAVRAIEHVVLGGAFTALVMKQIFGLGFDIDPVMRALASLF